MSTTPDKEPAIIHEFRILYDYVRLMGDQVNQLYARIERIEHRIEALNERLGGNVQTHLRDLQRIREIMVRKGEIEALLERLAASALPLPELRGREPSDRCHA